ncbi:hypothetical protein NUV26_09375, partial [Burkholderia pseudomultivorans]|uniref:hypothetical protein n=1 Tax=Burkholderia pseudomultivorans TaxID=1207504 RepID=UPI0028745127
MKSFGLAASAKSRGRLGGFTGVTNDARDFLPFLHSTPRRRPARRVFRRTAKYLRGPFVYQGGKPPRRRPVRRFHDRFDVSAYL